MDSTVDVEGMRRTAANLRTRAAELATAGARLDAQLASMVYAGPAADRFRATVSDRRRRIGQAASEMHASADTLTRAAFTVESSLGQTGGAG